MAKKKTRRKFHEKTLTRDDHTSLQGLVDDRVHNLDMDLQTLKESGAYELMELQNVDDVEHHLRRIRASYARLGDLLRESNRVVLRSEKKL